MRWLYHKTNINNQVAAKQDTMDMKQALMEINGPNIEKRMCNYPHCLHQSKEQPCKECAACNITHYCCKECQKADWKRHKPLCISCRPFKEYTTKKMVPQKKMVIDQYSKVQLPPIDKEYFNRYPTDHMVFAFIKTGVMETQRMMSENVLSLNKEDNDVRNLFKRWQEISPALFDFLEGAKTGDIFARKEYTPYEPGAPQQFRNTPLAEPAKLEGDKIVVDIGFVDFGMVFDSIKTLDPRGKPLIVVGYDAAPLCVAKSLVMHTMLKDSQVEARSIVEVWLSSLWSEKTLLAFKRALRELLEPSVGIDSKVKAILSFWNKRPNISMESALDFQRNGFLQGDTAAFAMNCCALAYESDRVEFLRYCVTKAMYEDKTTVYGSIVMNTKKKSIGVLQSFASCIEAAPYYIHTKDSKHFVSCDSFMGRNKIYFEQTIQCYMDHVRSGNLVFTPKLSTGKWLIWSKKEHDSPVGVCI